MITVATRSVIGIRMGERAATMMLVPIEKSASPASPPVKRPREATTNCQKMLATAPGTPTTMA